MSLFYGNSYTSAVGSVDFSAMRKYRVKLLQDAMKKNKIDFDVMAKMISSERKTAVMDYGWVSPDFFSPSLAHAINTIQDGNYGGPYKGQKGYYLIKVKEREREGIAQYEEVRDNIRNALLSQKRQAAIALWITQKKKASKIEVFLK